MMIIIFWRTIENEYISVNILINIKNNCYYIGKCAYKQFLCYVLDV